MFICYLFIMTILMTFPVVTIMPFWYCNSKKESNATI